MEFQVREGLVMRTRTADDAAEVFAIIDAQPDEVRERWYTFAEHSMYIGRKRG